MLNPPYIASLILLFVSLCMGVGESAADEKETIEPLVLELAKASMCERIEDYSPVNLAVVFSVSVGRISCFTSFDPVSKETQIEHRWYYKDTLTTKKKLYLKTPRWSTYSSIQLREVDKGPWRVEIIDSNNRILGVLRFSVTD